MGDVTVQARALDPRRDSLEVQVDTELGALSVDATGNAFFLSDGFDKHYVQNTAGGTLSASYATGPKTSLRSRLGRSQLTGATFAAFDAQLSLPHSYANLGASYLGGYGTAANPVKERRILPFVAAGTTQTFRLVTLSAELNAIGSIGIGRSDIPIALDSAEAKLAASVGEAGFDARLSGAIGYHDPKLYLAADTSAALSLSLDAGGRRIVGEGWSLTGRAAVDLERRADTNTPSVFVRAFVSLDHGRDEVHLSGSVGGSGEVMVGLGASSEQAGRRVSLDVGLRNDGPTERFQPEASFAVTFGPRRGRDDDLATLRALTDRPDTDFNTSHQRLFALLGKGDPGALFALRDLSGAYGWTSQKGRTVGIYEAPAFETETRGVGDCTDQATLWSLYINRYGSHFFEPAIFMYHRADEVAGHGFLLVREKATGRVFAMEYGHLYLLQGIAADATMRQIGEAARAQLEDTRNALSGYLLRSGATSSGQSFDDLKSLMHRPATGAVIGGLRAIPLRGVDELLGRDLVLGVP